MSFSLYVVNSRGSVLNLEKDEQKVVEGRLRAFVENVMRASSVGGFNRPKLIGWYNHEEPKMIGFLLEAEMPSTCDYVRVMPNWTFDPCCSTLLRLPFPEWLSPFKQYACLLEPDYIRREVVSKMIDNLWQSLLTAAICFWKTYPATKIKNNVLNAQICEWAPLREKSALLNLLRFRLFDPYGNNRMGEEVVEVCFAVQKARRSPGQMLLYARKVDLSDFNILNKIFQFYLRGGVVLIIEYDSAILLPLLKNVVSIGGCALLRMTADTPLEAIMNSANLETKTLEGRLTRNENSNLDSCALTWTLGYLHSEGHLGKNEFLDAMADVIECNICGESDQECHSADHDRLILHKANELSAEFCGRDIGAEELIWRDVTDGHLKTDAEEKLFTKLFCRGLSLRQ